MLFCSSVDLALASPLILLLSCHYDYSVFLVGTVQFSAGWVVG